MAFVIAPVVMSGLAVFLALRPSQAITDASAASAMKSVASTSAKISQGFADDAALKRAEFEVDAIRAMLETVAQEYRGTVGDAIKKLDSDKLKQAGLMVTKRLDARMQETASKLGRKDTSAEDIQRIRSELAGAAADVDKAPQGQRDALARTLATLNEKVGVAEVATRDRKVLKDAETSLGSEMSLGSLSKLKGTVLDIQARLQKTNMASVSDSASIKRILEQVERKTDGASKQAASGTGAANSDGYQSLKSDVDAFRFLVEADSRLRQLQSSNAISGTDASALRDKIARNLGESGLRFSNMKGLADRALNAPAQKQRVLADLKDISSRLRSGQGKQMSSALTSQLEDAVRALGGSWR